MRATFFFALAAVAASCSSGSSDTGTINSGTFNVLGTEPLNGGRLFLNDPIRFDFSTPIELTTADLNTVSFSVLDLNNNPVAEQPTGHFEIDKRPGDDTPGRRLLFVPTLPTNDTFSDGGFKPGRTYLVRLVGGDRHNNNVLKDKLGNGLGNAQTFRFTTADGTTPAQLFRNSKPGGPRRTAFSVTPPTEAGGVPLNKYSTPTIEVRLEFDQALNPSSSNVPVALDTNPALRTGVDKGRIFLQYREGLASPIWLPADVEIELNDIARSVVVLRPIGVLPNNATVEVIVQSTVEDISGESNTGNAAYSQTFATFQTQALYEPQFDALVEDFKTSEHIDFDAPFVEPEAEVGTGFIRAGFAFEGSTTQLDFDPETQVTINTDFALITPANGLPFNVSGGVFNFRDVTIRDGVTVRGQGTRPMVWLVNRNMTVNGTLTVSGGDGQRVDTLNSANFPSGGGIGACGGGNGGRGSPNSTARSFTGQAGFGPGQRPGFGGGGGLLACVSCAIGSGGGGGSLATQGDPFYKENRGAGTSFQQVDGLGGNGCDGASGSPGRTLSGGVAGPRIFTDAATDNDFWGSGVNMAPPGKRIRGELATPVGGGGGGGGGDHANSCAAVDAQFINDNKGGGGGGGGGVLVVKALGRITVGPNGFIKADGGLGGGGEQAGSCNAGGGGGGGSGGMVILMSATGIDINAKRTVVGANSLWTYAANEYRFAISADGGVTRTGQFLSPDVIQKYALLGTSGAVLQGTQYDVRPLGGFGGLGVVQLMAPPGTNSDGTNTVLDDNINYFWNVGGQTVQASGVDKQGLLAWRGFPNAQGQFLNDAGQTVLIGRSEGDIRPTPILLPVPFNAVTRLRSKWIDLGSAVRRSVTGPNGEPRSITDPLGTLRGPTFTFNGVTNDATLANGYASYQVVGGSARVVYPAMLANPEPVVSAAPTTAFRGEPAHRIQLATSALGTENDRYIGYEAELLGSTGTVLGSFRIVSHTDRVLTVAADANPIPSGVASCQIRAKFFKIVTDGVEGLGSTYTSAGSPVPFSNVKIGFAFHQNPDPNAAGTFERYPTSGFAYDLADPTRIEFLRQRGMRYVQWDVQFNATYPVNTQNTRPFGPTSPRPELRFLRLPFRF